MKEALIAVVIAGVVALGGLLTLTNLPEISTELPAEPTPVFTPGGGGGGGGNGGGGGGAMGADLAQQAGCLSCHSTDGSTLVGPTWQGLFGSQRPLEDGTTVTADEDYLRESIRDPGAKVVQDFPNAMPADIAANLSEEQVDSLIEYIRTLQ